MEVAGEAVLRLLHQVQTVVDGEVNPPKAHKTVVRVMGKVITVGTVKVRRPQHPMVEISSTVPVEIRDTVVTAAMVVAVVTVGMVTRVPGVDTEAAMVVVATEEATVAATEIVITVLATTWRTLIGQIRESQRFKRIFIWSIQM